MSDLDARFQAGCAAVLAGGRLARRYSDNLGTLKVETKGPQDHASAADREIEELIIGLLGRAFPSDNFYGEEGGGTARDDVWVIDPIDGTTNFIRGLTPYCVSLAYMQGGKVELAMIYHPPSEELFTARPGRGSNCNGRPIKVSGCKQVSEALVGVGFSYRRPVKTFIETTGRLLDARCEVRRSGSGALAMAHVAAGRLDPAHPTRR